MTITTMSASSTETRVLDALGLVARAASTLTRLYRAYHNRCAVAALDAVSDHMLADIGLTRNDICDVLAEPIWRDPTSLMRDRARGRRRAQ
jgi:uncharacterized protein YjiS (DUF1127 family)